MLRYINSKSQECFVDVPLTVPSKAPFGEEYELRIIDTIKEQFVVELDPRPRLRLSEPFFNAKPKASTTSIIDNTFWRSRFLLSQLGFLTWEKRQKVDLLDKVERLKRELKNLDNRGPIRENHKFACIYVGNGQEDKQSILSNQAGSVSNKLYSESYLFQRAFENFVRSLGWEVELSSHRGYMGGLQNNGSNGLSSIYYADSSLELMYHVSTMFNHEEPVHIKGKLDKYEMRFTHLKCATLETTTCKLSGLNTGASTVHQLFLLSLLTSSSASTPSPKTTFSASESSRKRTCLSSARSPTILLYPVMCLES